MHLTARPSGWRFQIRIPRTGTVQRANQLGFADIGHPLHVRKQVDGK